MSPDTARAVAQEVADRTELWVRVIQEQHLGAIAEVGVFRGAFAHELLDRCPGITSYTMIDPWQHLEDWNKPANRPDDVFEGFYREAMAATEAHAAKRRVLRGRTSEVVGEIEDGSLDLAYVDGDHTLRGITIDLLQVYPKVRSGGFIGGDDLSPTIWQHAAKFEPSFVFPFAAHFAEAMGHAFYALPFNQFLIHKSTDRGFEYHDLVGKYPTTALLPQLRAAARRKPGQQGRGGKTAGRTGGKTGGRTGGKTGGKTGGAAAPSAQQTAAPHQPARSWLRRLRS